MNLVLGRYRALFIWRTLGEILHQHQLLTFLIFKQERSAPSALYDFPNFLDTSFEMFFPPFERCPIRNAEGGPGDHPSTEAARRDSSPVEESQISARRTLGVAIKQVIRRDIILVHGFFHQPHAQNLGIKTQII